MADVFDTHSVLGGSAPVDSSTDVEIHVVFKFPEVPVVSLFGIPASLLEGPLKRPEGVLGNHVSMAVDPGIVEFGLPEFVGRGECRCGVGRVDVDRFEERSPYRCKPMDFLPVVFGLSDHPSPQGEVPIAKVFIQPHPPNLGIFEHPPPPLLTKLLVPDEDGIFAGLPLEGEHSWPCGVDNELHPEQLVEVEFYEPVPQRLDSSEVSKIVVNVAVTIRVGNVESSVCCEIGISS